MKVKFSSYAIVFLTLASTLSGFGVLCIFFSLGIVVGDPDKILITYSDHALWTCIGIMLVVAGVAATCSAVDHLVQNKSILIEPEEIKKRDAEILARELFEEIIETKFKNENN